MEAFSPLFIVISSDTVHVIGINLWDRVHLGKQSLPSSYDAQRKVLYIPVFDMQVQNLVQG